MLRNVRVVSNLRIIKVILKANVAHEKDSNAGNNLPSWIQEAPEEIDVLLAQRDFVQAQKILLKCEKTLATEHPKSSNDTKHQLVEKRKMIVEVLCAELSPAADRSLRAGPRGQRVPAQAEVSNNISNLCVKISQHSKIKPQNFEFLIISVCNCRRAIVKLLIQLGEERKAARLFLESRTAAQKYSRKNLVMEGRGTK